MICEKLGASDCLAIVDIDSELKDPQVWSSYAPDMYNNIRVTEVCDLVMCFFFLISDYRYHIVILFFFM